MSDQTTQSDLDYVQNVEIPYRFGYDKIRVFIDDTCWQCAIDTHPISASWGDEFEEEFMSRIKKAQDSHDLVPIDMIIRLLAESTEAVSHRLHLHVSDVADDVEELMPEIFKEILATEGIKDAHIERAKVEYRRQTRA
jgi:hypothetical protein